MPTFVFTILVLFALTAHAFGDGWAPSPIALKLPLKHPVIAATPEELGRLKAAWKSTGPDHDALAERFARADAAIKSGITFPPEGGQHNQWYQCDKCQIALKTVDATHHQCPKCKTVYSGFPYDNVLYQKQHNANIARAEDAAWAYAATGEKKYADLAATVLVGYADRYLKYPMVVNGVTDKSVDVAAGKLTKYKSAGHIAEQTLNESMYMVQVAIAYDLIHDSGALTAEQQAHIEKEFIRAMIDCINVHNTGKSNWQTWHNAANIYAGAVLGDQKLIERAILDKTNGFAFQMTSSVSEEGMWYENSWGYHYYTLMALTHMAEGSRRLGINLYDHPRLRNMYLLAFDYEMADGSLPRLGDSVQETAVRPNVNEFGYAAYQDSRLFSTLSSKPTFDSILVGRDTALAPCVARQTRTSILVASAGHAILNTDGPGKLSAAMTFGPFGGFHGHFDKNTFVLFGFGEELGIDPGRAASQAYRLPIHKEWYRATAGHNGVLVDGQSQVGADGKLIAFAAKPSYAAVSADAGPAFPNATHKRLCVLTPTYLLVVDELQASDGKPHVFDWIYHDRAKQVRCELPQAAARARATPGYKYLSDVKSFDAPKDGVIRAAMSHREITTHAMIVPEKGDEIFTATGPVRDVDDRAAMLIVRRKGQHVLFVSIIEPTKGDSALEDLSVTQDAGNIHVTFRQKQQTDEFQTIPGLAELTVTTSTATQPAKEVLSLKKQ